MPGGKVFRKRGQEHLGRAGGGEGGWTQQEVGPEFPAADRAPQTGQGWPEPQMFISSHLGKLEA